MTMVSMVRVTLLLLLAGVEAFTLSQHPPQRRCTELNDIAEWRDLGKLSLIAGDWFYSTGVLHY